MELRGLPWQPAHPAQVTWAGTEGPRTGIYLESPLALKSESGQPATASSTQWQTEPDPGAGAGPALGLASSMPPGIGRPARPRAPVRPAHIVVRVERNAGSAKERIYYSAHHGCTLSIIKAWSLAHGVRNSSVHGNGPAGRSSTRSASRPPSLHRSCSVPRCFWWSVVRPSRGAAACAHLGLLVGLR